MTNEELERETDLDILKAEILRLRQEIIEVKEENVHLTNKWLMIDGHHYNVIKNEVAISNNCEAFCYMGLHYNALKKEYYLYHSMDEGGLAHLSDRDTAFVFSLYATSHKDIIEKMAAITKTDA